MENHMEYQTENLWQNIQMERPDVFITTQSSKIGPEVPPHSHHFYEILFCRRGNIFYVLDDQRFRLQHGDILLIPPGLSHQPQFPEPLTEPYERYVLWISEPFWNQCITEDPSLNFAFDQCKIRGSYVLRSGRPTWSSLFLSAETLLLELNQQRIGWESCIRHITICLMAHISRTYYYQDIAAPPAEKESLADNIYRYIIRHQSENITLEQTSRHFTVSKSTISHLFTKQYNLSFHQFLILRRLMTAKNEILSGTPLKQVWQTCGFSDYASFYRAFKKEYGVSPGRFRDENKAKQ